MIYFSDKAYYSNSFSSLLSNGSEGRFSWTIPSVGLAKGTVVMFTVTSSAAVPSVATTPSVGSCTVLEGWTSTTATTSPFGQNGDSMLVYQGSEANPSFIFGFNSGLTSTGITNGWNTGLSSNANGGCELPAGLTEGTTAVGFGGAAHIDNFRYNSTKLSGTKAEILAAICNRANWLSDDATEYNFTPGAGVFSGTNPIFTINSVPVASAVSNTGTLTVGQQLTGSYSYSDPDNDAQSGTTFKWYRSDDALGLNRSAIASATAQNYTLTAADVGKFISFEVTPRDGIAFGTAVESAARGPVVAAVLPVKLAGFFAKPLSNGIELSWSVESMVNHREFRLYKWTADQQWKLLSIFGSVAGTSVSSYRYVDVNPVDGTNLYQLVQVDLDGTVSELGQQFSLFGLASGDLMVYPNPTFGKVTVRLPASMFELATLTDMNGKILLRMPIAKKATTLMLDLSLFSRGNYLLNLKGQGLSKVVSIMRR
ncbi:T9SS type A sorting domain-containing protein [Pedobacter sp.]